MFRIGELIDGRYRIVREIGRGGTGIVYLVLHEQAGQLRAMKVMRAAGDSRTLQEELRILRGLHHRMLPEIADVVFCEQECCLILQYFEGETLEQCAGRRKASIKEALDWGGQLCEVMQYLHSRPVPVYYFDLKPSNIIRDEKGKLFLVDFGSARSKYENGEELPLTGTHGYAAPELYRPGATGDARADVYSVGAVLYYVLCGRKPRGGETAAQCRKALEEAGIEDRRAAAEMAGLLASCLRIGPGGRMADCKRMQQRLWHISGKGKLRSALRYAGKGFYLIAGVFSILCLFASVLCFSASAGMRSRVYASDLQRSALAGEADKRRLLEEAVMLFPERGEPYMALIDAAAQDGIFSAEESRELTGILYGRSMGRGTDHISCLREDADAFLKVSFRLGMVYYFLSGGSGDKNTAAGWLAQAADPKLVSRCRDRAGAEGIARDAGILLDLCEYYNMSLTLSGRRRETDPVQLWEKLERLLTAGKEDDAENAWILQEWMQIFYDNMDLLREAAGEAKIREALEKAGARLPPGEEETKAQELRAFYDCIAADWDVLCGGQSPGGEGE